MESGAEVIDPAVDQARAAWAAVNEARRGLSIAWVSAVINGLVVMTAVGVPYLQRHFETVAEEQQKIETRRTVFDYLQRQVGLAKTALSNLKVEEDFPPETELSQKGAILLSKHMALLAERFEKKEQAEREILQVARQDPDLAAVVDVYSSVASDAAFDMRNYSLLLSNMSYVRYGDYQNVERGLYTDMVQQMRDVRLLLELNDKGGQTTSGRLIMADCEDKQFKRQCNSPL